MRQERFFPHGLLAIAPSAIGATFDLIQVAEPDITQSGPCVLSIRGPLLHHWSNEKDQWYFDNYDAIKCRAACAFASESVSCVVLAISSPGGLVSGCFECADELRALAAKSGKRLIAYVDGQATSAAYALACAADSIYAPETGVVGSIGVIETMIDTTALDAAQGLRFAVIASGARKADTNPHTPISTEAVATVQAHVDSVAKVFFNTVARARKLTPEKVRGLEAGCFHGQEALDLHLVDQLITLEGLIAMLADPTQAQAQSEGKPSMASKVSAVVAQLAELAGSDDPKESANAKKMLSAYCAEDKDEDKPAEEEDKDKKEPKAEDKEEKPEKKEEASAVVASSTQASSADLTKPRTEVRAEIKAEADRSALLAARPDLKAEQLAALRKVPLSALATVLDAIPVVKSSTVKDAIAAVTGTEATAATKAAAETEGTPREGYTLESLDRQMGLAAATGEVTHERNVTKIPTMTPEQARARIAAKKGAVK